MCSLSAMGPTMSQGMIEILRLLAPESKVWGEGQEWSHGITFWLFFNTASLYKQDLDII